MSTQREVLEGQTGSHRAKRANFGGGVRGANLFFLTMLRQHSQYDSGLGFSFGVLVRVRVRVRVSVRVMVRVRVRVLG